jgi:hypothetical protein
MSLQGTDLLAQLALKRLAKRERATAILREGATPGQASLLTLGLALIAGVATLFVERSSIPESLESPVVWGVVAIVWIAGEQWRIGRRLDAAIELLELDRTDAS